MFPRPRPWPLVRHFRPYKAQTQEVARVDYKTLQRLPPSKFIELVRWEQTLRIHNTFHVIEERLKPYVNQPSRDGTYIELLPQEYWLLQTQSLEDQIRNWRTQLVEIGFNRRAEICKVAYVWPLLTGRVLFFCLGMDCGLKTLYVTPTFKDRYTYQGANYLTVEQALDLEGTGLFDLT